MRTPVCATAAPAPAVWPVGAEESAAPPEVYRAFYAASDVYGGAGPTPRRGAKDVSLQLPRSRMVEAPGKRIHHLNLK